MIKATIFVAACLLGTSSLFAQQQKKGSASEFSSEFSTEKPVMTSSQPVQSTNKAERSEQLILQPVGTAEKTGQSESQATAKPVSSTVKPAPSARIRKENTTEH